MIKKSLVTLPCLLLISACVDQNNVEVKEVNGQTYLLKQSASEVFIVENGSLRPLTEGTTLTTKNRNSVISESFTIHNSKLKIDIRSKVVDDRVLYQVLFQPVNSGLSNGGSFADGYKQAHEWFRKISEYEKYNYISVIFTDKDGFKISNQVIALSSDKTRLVNADGSVHQYQYDGEFTLNPNISKHIENISLTWSISE